MPRRRAPACTHVSMERIPLKDIDYDSCPNCGNYRTLGFLYICRQERDMAYLESVATGDHGSDSEDTGNIEKSTVRRELRHIGMSESIIATAEQGLYTSQQLDRLKALKMELNEVIAGVLQVARIKDSIASKRVNTNEPPNTDGASNSTPGTTLESIPSCTLVACHSCRPYFRDRISMSFDAVFNDEIRPFQPAEADILPVKSVQIIRNIGPYPTRSPLLKKIDDATPITILSASGCSDESAPTPSESSMLTYKTTQSEIDAMNTTRHCRRRFYKMGHLSSGEIVRDLSRLPFFSREGLREAFKNVFRTTRESSSSGSNITLPMPRTAAARDSDDIRSMGEFDMGALRRVKRQKDRLDLRRSRVSGVSTPAYGRPDEVVGRQSSFYTARIDGESDSSGSIASIYSCVSEGSEVEVDGGVALTEEAVETHTPDIISDPLAVECIMTQA